MPSDRAPLSAILLEQLEAHGAAPPVAPPGLDAQLEAALASARAAWPELTVSAERYLAHVADRLAGEREPLAAVGALRHDELYLALAASTGDARAIALLEARYLRGLTTLLARAQVVGESVDDLLQMLRQRLLVGDATSPPGILGFGGQGALGGWLRVVAARFVVDRQRRVSARRRERQLDDAIFTLTDDEDPERSSMRERYRRELARAFEQAMAELSPRQRNLLRHQVLHGMAQEAIASLYGVHRATVIRQLAEVRQLLLDGTQRHLVAQLRVGRSEVDSILSLVRSTMHVSIHRILGEAVEP
jgi:RNA polymerase sigma-70 factor, ECF subfamily